jgi:uncharacterized membrane protein
VQRQLCRALRADHLQVKADIAGNERSNTMWTLVSGLIIFFGTHLSPGVFGLRPLLVKKLGEGRFRSLYIATSVIGMLMIIGGKAYAPDIGLYLPPVWARPLVPVLMAVACILLAALFIPSNLRRLTRHPMLWATSLWSVAHLLANGDLASSLLFGGFGAYALISMWSLNRRGKKQDTTHYSRLNDGLVVAAGLCIYVAGAVLHPYIVGVPAVL